MQVVFAGHTHMDDFRVIGTPKVPLVVNKLVPSVSPIFKNNPAFQVYLYDENRRDYRLSDILFVKSLNSRKADNLPHTTLEEFEKCQETNDGASRASSDTSRKK